MNAGMEKLTHCGHLNGHTVARVREVAPDSPMVARRFLLDNGAHEVELRDPTQAGWDAYCASRVARLRGKPLAPCTKQIPSSEQ